MSEIPEDICKLAEQVWRDIRMIDRDEPEAWIALAINHERERCIRIIDCGCDRDHCGCPGNCAKDDIEAIRTEP